MFNKNFGGMSGFNNSKRSSVSKGDFDRDGVSNRKDCEPLNYKKQGPKHDERIGYQQDRVDYAEEEYVKSKKEVELARGMLLHEKGRLTNLKSQRRSD